MAKVVGIVFKDVGKIYWFSPDPYTPKKNDKVVVETVRGVELGFVETEIKEIDDNLLEHELKPIVRMANKYDIKNYFANLEKAEKDYPKRSKANHHVNNTWNHAHRAKNHGDKVKREKADKQPVKRADNY